MTHAFAGVRDLAAWEDEGGALQPMAAAGPGSAAHFREREAHCLTRANAWDGSEMGRSYLDFAGGYAALARFLEG